MDSLHLPIRALRVRYGSYRIFTVTYTLGRGDRNARRVGLHRRRVQSSTLGSVLLWNDRRSEGHRSRSPVKRLLQGAALTDVADLGAVDDPALLEEYAAFAAAVPRNA